MMMLYLIVFVVDVNGVNDDDEQQATMSMFQEDLWKNLWI
jgi:hypothetical protein